MLAEYRMAGKQGLLRRCWKRHRRVLPGRKVRAVNRYLSGVLQGALECVQRLCLDCFVV